MFKRLLMAVPAAILITGALFLLMRFLIASPSGKPDIVESEFITLTRKIKDTESLARERNPEPPDIEEPASQAASPDHESVLKDIDMNTEIQSEGPPMPRGFVAEKPGLHHLDGDARPLIRGKPPFPACAKGPGVVVLEFVVEPDGSVSDVTIISATSSCFSRAAERAALSWRYRPKVVNSKAVRSKRQRVKLIFEPD